MPRPANNLPPVDGKDDLVNVFCLTPECAFQVTAPAKTLWRPTYGTGLPGDGLDSCPRCGGPTDGINWKGREQRASRPH